MKKVNLLLAVMLVASVALADELHNKAMAATKDLQRAIDEMHVIDQEHGPEFGGHMGRAAELARQAEKERGLALDYYRAHHPGWQ